MENLVKENSIINISLDKTYSSQEDFWADNQDLVYAHIIKIYDKFLVSDESSFGMTVATTIDGDSQKIYFGFEKDQPEILVELLMPYYIENEQYEICAILRDIYKVLVVMAYNKSLDENNRGEFKIK